jgi:AcrR family transcriptional regulator
VTRKYELKKRAQSQAETRRRIVDAAVELHRTKGPARTTFSDVARLAGVQRHTLYRHFPDERHLFAACSSAYFEMYPPPDPAAWRASGDSEERLTHGLVALYEWYERIEDMLTSVLRDIEVHALTRETQERLAGPVFGAMHDALADVVPEREPARAALDLALDFHAWKRLRASGLSSRDAAEAMVRAIEAQ